MDKLLKYGMVFAGGGAKGAYQIGVWQALEKLHIPIGAVVGASIGAINGALFAQGDFALARKAWSGVDLKSIIDMETPLAEPEDLLAPRNFPQILKQMLENKGIDMQPVKAMLEQYISFQQVTESEIDFGLIAYDLNHHQAVKIFKKEMTHQDFYEYIMASACFPVFKSVEIENQRFVDGGVYNNMPAEMLIEKEYRNLILVDLKGLGRVKRFKKKNLNIITIKPKTALGGTFEMSNEVIKTTIKRGYLDTYQAFGRLTGKIYYLTFQSSSAFCRQYSPEILDGLEIAAQFYGLNPYKIYSIPKFLGQIKLAYEKEKLALEQNKSEKYTINVQSLLSQLNHKKKMMKNFYSPRLLTELVDVLQSPKLSKTQRNMILTLTTPFISGAKAILAIQQDEKWKEK